MAWPELTYERYAALGGREPEASFADLLPWAARAVRRECLGRVPSTDAEVSAAEAAITAAVEVDAAWGGTHGMATGGSVSIGGFSASGGSDGGTYASDLSDAIRDALAGTGLACRVVL